MASSSTRDALLEQGALLFAQHGVDGVTTRQLHDAVGARNTSALHYHFGDRRGLVDEIVRTHVEAVEARRARMVAEIAADDRSADLRSLLLALAAPMADQLATKVGRAQLRLLAQLNHPAQAYELPFKRLEAPAGRAIVRWLHAYLEDLPHPLRRERLALLRGQLIGLMAERAQLLDELPGTRVANHDLFLHNLVDVLVAGLSTPPSAATLAMVGSSRKKKS